MNNIVIKRDGRVVSTVFFGADLYGFASLLKGEAPYCGSTALSLKDCKLYLVYDNEINVQGHANDLSRRIDFAGKFAVSDVSEEIKTMDTVLEICRWLLDKGADRNSVIVGLGGGILLDVVGFVAGIYKRGVRCIYIPTTLLAQVDAAIGGKTGVNLDGYKNILGVFKQPELTYICYRPLATLRDNTFRDGLAELVKTLFIENVDNKLAQLLRIVRTLNLVGRFVALRPDDADKFIEIVAAAAGVKTGIVERDELESGERRKLNLGHTFAHTIEYVSHSRAAKSAGNSCAENVSAETSAEASSERVFSHGEAVAMGLAMAAHLSVKLGLAEPKVEADILRILETCELPTSCPYPIGDLLDAMSKDKKAEGDKIHFVLLRSIGDVVIKDLSLSEVMKLL